jgi:hypothetical protein
LMCVGKNEYFHWVLDANGPVKKTDIDEPQVKQQHKMEEDNKVSNRNLEGGDEKEENFSSDEEDDVTKVRPGCFSGLTFVLSG